MYVDLALVHSANADAVFRNIMRVTVIFVKVKLGIIVQWQRPGRCPQSMPPEDLEHYQQASKCGSPFIDSTTGVSTHRNHFGHHFS